MVLPPVMLLAIAAGVVQEAPPTDTESLRALHRELGANYPCFELKSIDWDAVGAEIIPRAGTVSDDAAFGLICLELVARLEDSHARLLPGSCPIPEVPWPRFSPGLACLIGDDDAPVVFDVAVDSPAAAAGVTPGMTVVTIDGLTAADRLAQRMDDLARYSGYSSRRCLRHDAARALAATFARGEPVHVVLRDVDGSELDVVLDSSLGRRPLPRRPVPVPGVDENANVSWTRLGDDIGYISVRRLRDDLGARLDAAVTELGDARGLIIDLRGNSGGGFDGSRAHANFTRARAPEDEARPWYAGPIAVLIDARCISAGEGWASWFVAQRRAILFGETTAGASSRKTEYTLPCGRFRVRYSVRPYRGALDRWIERRGIEPDVAVMPRAADLAARRDTVLEAARRYLDDGTLPPAP